MKQFNKEIGERESKRATLKSLTSQGCYVHAQDSTPARINTKDFTLLTLWGKQTTLKQSSQVKNEQVNNNKSKPQRWGGESACSVAVICYLKWLVLNKQKYHETCKETGTCNSYTHTNFSNKTRMLLGKYLKMWKCLLNWIMGRSWKKFEADDRKSPDCLKQTVLKNSH